MNDEVINTYEKYEFLFFCKKQRSYYTTNYDCIFKSDWKKVEDFIGT